MRRIIAAIFLPVGRGAATATKKTGTRGKQMSAFLVTKKHIDYVVAAIMEIGVATGSVTEEEDKHGGFRDRLGQWLVDMNIRAVDYRYSEKNAVPLYRNTYIGPSKTMAELVLRYKAIECLAYQCAEGDIPETPLYKQLIAAENTVASMIIPGHPDLQYFDASDIIGRMPEYKAAPWHIDDPEPAPATPAANVATLPTTKARKPRKPAARKTTPKAEPTTADYYDHTIYATI